MFNHPQFFRELRENKNSNDYRHLPFDPVRITWSVLVSLYRELLSMRSRV